MFQLIIIQNLFYVARTSAKSIWICPNKEKLMPWTAWLYVLNENVVIHSTL